MKIKTAESIRIERPVYTVTLTCPICHRQLTGYPGDGAVECPHCKVKFRVVTKPGPQEFKGNE